MSAKHASRVRALVEVDEPEEEAEVAEISFDFEDESAGELGVQSDDGDDDLSYLSSDDAAYLADSALA